MGINKGPASQNEQRVTSKEALKTQVPTNLPPPPPPPQLPADLGLKANPNLKKKRMVEELEEGEVGPQKGVKQQRKTKEPKDKRASSMENRDEVELCRGQRS